MQETEIRSILSKNIKLLRSRRKWSQATLAYNAGISIPFLSDIERGNKWPYPETLTRLAQALEIEIYELFKPENQPPGDIIEKIDQSLEDAAIALQISMEQAIQQSFANVRRQYRGTRV